VEQEMVLIIAVVKVVEVELVDIENHQEPHQVVIQDHR
jgi:hypothetical protein